jgi:SCY1-like protein 2
MLKLFAHRINMYRILPCLVKEFVNPPMIPFVLPNVLQICESCTEKEYETEVWPHLKPVMKITDPIQILLIFMQKMDLLLKLTRPDDVKSDVLPLLYRALECNSQQIQELCLSIIPSFGTLVDYSSMKNSLIPRIKKLCISSPVTSVKVNSLICLGKLINDLDKWLVIEEVLPFLPKVNSREPAVIMSIIGIYKIVLGSEKLGMTKEIITTNVIPFLSPLCIENGLSLTQFQTIMTLMKDLINRVEKEQRTKLEQISLLQKESKVLDFESEMFVPDFQTKKPVTYPKLIAPEVVQTPTPPPKVEPPKVTSQPKDLTSTLIQANLKQLNITSPTMSPAPLAFNNITPMSAPFSSNFNNPPQMTTGLNSITSPTNNFAMNPIRPTWDGNVNNNLMAFNQSYGQQNGKNNNNNATNIQLSKEEILDFLK